jgi:hypothetical protein
MNHFEVTALFYFPIYSTSAILILFFFPFFRFSHLFFLFLYLLLFLPSISIAFDYVTLGYCHHWAIHLPLMQHRPNAYGGTPVSSL